MKKNILISLMILSFTLQAQFINSKAPTKFELQLNNTQEITSLMKMTAQAKSLNNFKDMQKILGKLVMLKPYIPAFKYQLAEAYALNDDKTSAFNALIELQKQGLYFNVKDNVNFANINSYPVFNYIKENLDANGKHFGKGKESFVIDKSFSGLLFESLAFDEKSQSFLMGSLRDGRVIKISNSGEISTLIDPSKGGKNGPWATIDLAVDASNDVLWVASSAISQFSKVSQESVGLSGIFKYQLSTGKLVKSILIPENKRPSVISSIHLTPQGDLYLVSSLKNIVLKLAKDKDDFSVAFTTTKYKSLRNITGDDTGKLLYLSDQEEGIIIMNLENQQIYTLPNTPGLNLTNISDLIYDDNGLILIQSGFQPERILRLELEIKKLGLANIFPVEAANPKFNSPSYGTIVDGGVYYITNSQIPKTNMQGGLVQGQQWENMYVYSSNKHYNEKETLEYQTKIDEYKKKSGAEDPDGL